MRCVPLAGSIPGFATSGGTALPPARLEAGLPLGRRRV